MIISISFKYPYQYGLKDDQYSTIFDCLSPQWQMNLSERENEVLALIVKEFSSQEIAERLQISIRTVDTHRKHIGKKLNTKSLIGLTKYAIQAGMIEGFRYSKQK